MRVVGEVTGATYQELAVVLYGDAHYQGDSFMAAYDAVSDGTFDNETSFIHVPVVKTLALYADAVCGGAALKLPAGDYADLTALTNGGSTWNDNASSFKIY